MPILKPALLILAAALPLAAQSPLPTNNARVKAALDIIKTDNAWTLQQQVELTQIPAPPFKETARPRVPASPRGARAAQRARGHRR
jgi:hypothetical protein